MTKQKNDWLLDAEVQYKVTPVKGRWEVSLLFINTKKPKSGFGSNYWSLPFRTPSRNLR
jgi:hypothetical protein